MRRKKAHQPTTFDLLWPMYPKELQCSYQLGYYECQVYKRKECDEKRAKEVLADEDH